MRLSKRKKNIEGLLNLTVECHARTGILDILHGGQFSCSNYSYSNDFDVCEHVGIEITSPPIHRHVASRGRGTHRCTCTSNGYVIVFGL